MVIRWENGVRGINWESGIDTDISLYIKYITNKDLLYSTGNTSQYFVMTYVGKESKKRVYIYLSIYFYLIHFAVKQKLTTL